MISISGKKWGEKQIDKRSLNKLKQDTNFSEILSKLIINKEFDLEEIYSIENNILINNKFIKNNDFIETSKIFINALNLNEKICILGDYDVDGSASTALIIKFLDYIDHPYFYYIPDRENDGYGASVNLFKKLIKKKPYLIIMVDCGSTSNEAVEFLNKNNVKSIIIDHHEIYKPYPKSNSIINPKKRNGYEEFNYLCATALTYFFLDIVIKKMKLDFDIKKYLIYVLLATVCDVMPLRKLNRYIAKYVLQNFVISENKFFNKIYTVLKRKNKISINDLGFLIGPILNSGGRLNKSNYATVLLSTNSEKKIDFLSNELINLNEKRKIIENRILNSIDLKSIEKENNDIIVYYDPSINEGLIGIIASRLKDYFNKPSIVITNSKNLLKGSGRSINNFNLGSFIKKALDKKIILNGGGHQMAAGFVLKKDNLNLFKNFFYSINSKSDLKKINQLYDAKISASAFNIDFYHNINKLSPFGNSNIEPLFLIEKLKILKPKIIKTKHISCILRSSKGYSINSICFNSINTKLGEYLMNYKAELNVIGQIKENIWNNKISLQLTIYDLIK